MIAIALSCNPKLLLADEPTTALDVTIQAQILRLLKRLSADHDAAVITITHDLGVVAGMCQRILVMYAGRMSRAAPQAALRPPASPLHRRPAAQRPTPRRAARHDPADDRPACRPTSLICRRAAVSRRAAGWPTTSAGRRYPSSSRPIRAALRPASTATC